MAAAVPDGLLGPGGKAILPADYQGYTGGSWSELLRTSPMTAKYIILLYRMYGIYCLVFGLMGSAIAATAFRHGERWARWTLLVGNTIALASACRSRDHLSFPRSRAFDSTDGLTRLPPQSMRARRATPVIAGSRCRRVLHRTMTAEAWTAFGTVGTLIVITATAIVGLIQLRHGRAASQAIVMHNLFKREYAAGTQP